MARSMHCHCYCYWKGRSTFLFIVFLIFFYFRLKRFHSTRSVSLIRNSVREFIMCNLTKWDVFQCCQCIYSWNEQNERETHTFFRPVWCIFCWKKAWVCRGFIAVFTQCQAIMIIQPENVLQYLSQWFKYCKRTLCLLFIHLNSSFLFLHCHCWCFCRRCWFCCQLTKLFIITMSSTTTMTITEIATKADVKDNNFKMHERQRQRIEANSSPCFGWWN